MQVNAIGGAGEGVQLDRVEPGGASEGSKRRVAQDRRGSELGRSKSRPCTVRQVTSINAPGGMKRRPRDIPA